MTVTGRPFGENITEVPVHNSDVIRTPDTALAAEGGVAVLRGNLAPDGAVIKHIAAEPRLVKHTGPAVVFDSYSELPGPINDPAMNITPNSVLVLRNAGPEGRPRHARVRHAADSRLPAGPGRPGHGANFRRPDERHQLRCLRAARGP